MSRAPHPIRALLRRRFSATVLVVAAAVVLPSAAGCTSADEDTESSESDITVRPSPFWKNQLSFPDDPFVVASAGGQPRWVKFTVFTAEPTKVYFQDSNKYAFHYDFAKAHLPGFSRMTPETFAKLSLAAAGQKLITGAVLLPPRAETFEYGVQLIRQDAYPKEEVKKLFDLVQTSIKVAGGQRARAFYMPTAEQARSAETDRAWLESKGVTIGSPARWLSGDACYSSGWAFGKVVFVKGADIKAAYIDGRLKHDDILLTDAVPAETPYVAGIVTLSPSTPNSHVAILANSFQVPFVWPAAQTQRDRLQRLVGKEVVLRATSYEGTGMEGCSAEVLEIQGAVDPATRADLAALKRPAPLSIPARTHLGALTKSADGLKPADVKYFGGKAANFGTLRRTVPNNSRKAIGISFDLWERFIAQTLPSGKTLKQEVDERLAGITYPPNMAVLSPRLDEIRTLISDTATFAPADQAELLRDLRAFGFDPKVKIRFRSSTNIEDSNAFTGAGLYESFSGCLGDEDEGETGPSACDPTETKEKGVFRAIKKVYASFYGNNAVFERFKYQLDENKVGMALVAHDSFPDANEAANGVATVNVASFGTSVNLVTQKGAESVTNPTGAGLPEVVHADVYDAEVILNQTQGSSLVPLGQKVMAWEADYKEMVALLVKVTKAFKTDHGITTDAIFDVEYKKLLSGERIVKQIRMIPQRSTTPSVVPVLLNEPVRLCTHQGEYGNELANHRMKAVVTLTSRSAKLSAATLAKTLFTNADIESVENGRVVRKASALDALSRFAHSTRGEMTTDAWEQPGAKMSFETVFRKLVAPSEIPIAVTGDYRIDFAAKYAAPRPVTSFEGPATTLEDRTLIERCADTNADAAVQTIEGRGPRGLVVKTQFHYQKAFSAFDKTASLGKWVKTEIIGLTSRKITLTGWFSQTFRPEHHNFSENFVFEPALEPGIDAAVLAELAAKDIQLIVMANASRSSPDATFFVLKKSTQKLERL